LKISLFLPIFSINCLTSYSNNYHVDISNFIINCSKIYNINIWDSITYLQDEQILNIFKNQYTINTNFIENILNIDVKIGYGGLSNLLASLIFTQPIKIKTIDSSYFAQFEMIEENFHLISKALILKQYFSRILTNDFLSADEINRIKNENDHSQILIDGKYIDVEFASITFNKAY
jgi:hypothetical protein